MKRTPGRSAKEREKYWTQMIEKARAYPAGVTAFCTDRGISKDNYYQWFKRLRLKHPEWNDLNGNGSNWESEPETEVVEKAARRRFTAAYKSKILREADAAAPGQVAAMLRREGLYSSHLQKWRREESRLAHEARKRGPKANPLAAEVKRLRAENERLEKRLTKAGHIIELQKKIAEIMDVNLDKIPDDE
jgi:transposase